MSKQIKSNKPNAMFVLNGKMYKIVHNCIEEPTFSRIIKRYASKSIDYVVSLNQDRTYAIAKGVK
jgi:hypothetical protein